MSWSDKTVFVSMKVVGDNDDEALQLYADDSDILDRGLDQMRDKMATYIRTGKKE